jgi:hypothetical protein
MRLAAHIFLGISTALLAYRLAGEFLPAAVVFSLQVGLVGDAALKRLLGWEPLHTLLGMALVCGAVALYDLGLGLFALMGYGPHLLIDLFVEEEIGLFLPFSRRTVQHPIPRSEEGVMIGSALGALILLSSWL